MKILLKVTVLGAFLATFLSTTNAGIFTNCKSKCAAERCAGDPDRKKDCAKKCPNEEACQTALSKDELYAEDQKRYAGANEKAKKLLGPEETPAERKKREQTDAINQALVANGLQ